MQLNKFDGGLSVRFEPHLINADEGVKYLNIDNSKGSLIPLKQDSNENLSVLSNLYYFNSLWINSGGDRDYVEYQNKLYYSDGIGKPQKSADGITWYNLGIEKPTSKPNVTINKGNITGATISEINVGTGNFKTGDVIYYLVLDGSDKGVYLEHTVVQNNSNLRLTVTATGTIFVFRSITNSVFYRLYTGATYTVNDTNANLITQPTKVLYRAFRQYAYTYYNSLDGTESQPSDYSDEIEVIMANSVNINLVASTDPQVDKIELYRIGGDLPVAVKVRELANMSAVHIDLTADINVEGTALNASTNKEAPTGLKYLTEFNTMFFGCVGPKLYFTDIAFVNYWSEFNFITFNEDITGIGPTANGLAVFTLNKTYLIVGNGPSTLTKYSISSVQGCKAHKSIQYIKNTLVWVSNDGLCASSGGDIEVISESKLGKLNLNPIASVVYNNEYYLLTDINTLILDFRYNGMIFKYLDVIAQSIHYASSLDNVYYSKDGALYKLYGSTLDRTVMYKTGRLSEGTISGLKTYNKVYFYVEGTLTLGLYGNGNLLHTYELLSGFNEILFPETFKQGYFIEMEFVGTGKLLEVEYKVEGRQNGI